VAKALGCTAKGTVAAAVGAGLTVSTVDLDQTLNRHKHWIMAELERATGRAIRIDGDIALEPGRVARLRLTDAHLANAPWGSRPDMAHLRGLEAEVALLPLLSGRLQIERLTLTGADILLETDRTGQGNWALPALAADATGDDTTNRLTLANVALHDTRITWRNGRTATSHALRLKRAVLTTESLSAPLHVDVTGRWQDRRFAVAGEIGSVTALLADGPVLIAVAGRIAGTAFRVAGTAGEPPGRRGFVVNLAVEGKSLADLTPLIGVTAPAAGVFKIAGTARGDTRKLVLDKLAGTVAGHRLAGTLSIHNRGPRPRIDGALQVARLDLGQWAPAWHDRPGLLAVGGDRVFSDRALPLAQMTAVDLRLRLRAGTVVAPWADLSDVDVGILLDDGALTLARLRAHLFGGPLDGAASLNMRERMPTMTLRLDAPWVDLRKLIDGAGLDGSPEGTAEFAAELTSQGRSLAAIMANLGGDVRFVVRDLNDRSGAFDRFNREFGRIFDVLLGSDAALTDLDCVAGEFRIRDGKAEGRAAAARSGGVILGGDGQIDLAAERLDFRVSPQAQVASFHGGRSIRLRGHLADPKFHPTFAIDRSARSREDLCKRPAWQREVAAHKRPQYAFASPLKSDLLLGVDSGLTVAVQQELVDLGYNPGPIDGIVGPRTRQAIRNFQADHRRPLEDEVTQTLLRRLRATRRQRQES
jgi:uncharacterized protein involved in outer membrane biogenesis